MLLSSFVPFHTLFKKYFCLFIFGCAGSSLLGVSFGYGKQGLLFVVVHGLIIGMASPVLEHQLKGHGLSCSKARGIFPDQGSSPRPCIFRQGQPMSSLLPLALDTHFP